MENYSKIFIENNGPVKHEIFEFVATDLDNNRNSEKEDDTSFLSEEGRTNTLYEDPLLATPKSENNMLYHLVPKEEQDADVQSGVQEPLGTFEFISVADNKSKDQLIVPKVEKSECNIKEATSNAKCSNQQQALGEFLDRHSESEIANTTLNHNSNCTHTPHRNDSMAKTHDRKNKIQNIKDIFKCINCPCKTDKKDNLTVHMKTHTNDKSFVCSLCCYRSTRRSDLIRHMKTHTNEDTFSCSQCSYRARQRGVLVRHMRTHTKEKPFACSQCSYKARQRSDLVTHMRIHTNEKPFVCSQCSYRARRRSDLATHMRIHTNKKPFACSQCSYRATQRSNLVTHMSIHTNDKQFACSQCPYRAAQHGILVKHMRIHTNEKPFACSLCSYRSKRQSDLIRHMKAHTNK